MSLFRIGCNSANVSNLREVIDTLPPFDFVGIPLHHPLLIGTSPYTTFDSSDYFSSDLSLKSHEWTTRVLGIIEFKEPHKYHEALQPILHGMIERGNYLSLSAMMVKNPENVTLASWASLLTTYLQKPRFPKFWFRFKPAELKSFWEPLLVLLDHTNSIGIALDLTDLSSENELKSSSWVGHSIELLIIDGSAFSPAQNGPELILKPHYQLLMTSIFEKLNTSCHVYLEMDTSNHDRAIYYSALCNFRSDWQQNATKIAYLEYSNILQMPLQPLTDQLESVTYEVFEKDITKYLYYQDAMRAALKDLRKMKETIHILIIGGGRGPLVEHCLKVVIDLDIKVRVVVVEKNPNAYLTLTHRRKVEWPDFVTILKADVRDLDLNHIAAPPFDLCVSELLGSFGDNELSPECIESAYRLLTPEAICIPEFYASFLMCTSSASLYSNIGLQTSSNHSYEIPYVVNLRNAQFFDVSTHQAFHFDHRPEARQNSNKSISNRASVDSLIEFSIGSSSTTIHGFTGYFEAQLYGNVKISNHPKLGTKELNSWFPIFFPLKNPVFISPTQDKLTLYITRRKRSNKIWYEWALLKPFVTSLHNPDGRSYSMGTVSIT